ncbi:hypothetical protein Aeh1ORF089c [Aeromonas phage Aeh1]|uniref:Uncharacterized protein n=1 Tax=Aeromonas phage Aeh1 TaxID=2880362 RepID=Q76YZ6_9CAUD|nr:hypothetical protein Aeh1p095 [Aeromonas phage Aeh1]AAQ17750.1 hypothetical protein Aeh1ORF089c [Aeromonas phage Aeh1]
MKEARKVVFKDKKFKNFLIRMEQNLFCENVTVDGKTLTRLREGNMFSSTNLVNIASAFVAMFGTDSFFTKPLYNNINAEYDQYEKLRPIWPSLQTSGWQYRVISPTQLALYFKSEVPEKLLKSNIGKHFSMENWGFKDGETGMRVWHCDPTQYKSRVVITVPERKIGEDYLPRTDKKSVGFDIIYKNTRNENAQTLEEMSKKEVESQDVFDIDFEKVLPGFAQLQKLERVVETKSVSVKQCKQLLAQAQAQLELAVAEQQQAYAEYHEVMLTLQPKITIMTQVLDKYSFKEA